MCASRPAPCCECGALDFISEETGVGKYKGDTRSSFVLPPPRESLGKTFGFGGDGSVKEDPVAVVSSEYRVAEESSVP